MRIRPVVAGPDKCITVSGSILQFHQESKDKTETCLIQDSTDHHAREAQGVQILGPSSGWGTTPGDETYQERRDSSRQRLSALEVFILG